MNIKVNGSQSIEAFINVAGINANSDTETHNLAMNQIIELLNSDNFTIDAFKAKDTGKIILAIKEA